MGKAEKHTLNIIGFALFVRTLTDEHYNDGVAECLVKELSNIFPQKKPLFFLSSLMIEQIFLIQP